MTVADQASTQFFDVGRMADPSHFGDIQIVGRQLLVSPGQRAIEIGTGSQRFDFFELDVVR